MSSEKTVSQLNVQLVFIYDDGKNTSTLILFIIQTYGGCSWIAVVVEVILRAAVEGK